MVHGMSGAENTSASWWGVRVGLSSVCPAPDPSAGAPAGAIVVSWRNIRSVGGRIAAAVGSPRMRTSSSPGMRNMVLFARNPVRPCPDTSSLKRAVVLPLLCPPTRQIAPPGVTAHAAWSGVQPESSRARVAIARTMRSSSRSLAVSMLASRTLVTSGAVSLQTTNACERAPSAPVVL